MVKPVYDLLRCMLFKRDAFRTLSMGWFQRGYQLSLDYLCSAEFSPCWPLPEYIRALTHSASLRVFSVTPWVIVYRLYRVR